MKIPFLLKIMIDADIGPRYGAVQLLSSGIGPRVLLYRTEPEFWRDGNDWLLDMIDDMRSQTNIRFIKEVHYLIWVLHIEVASVEEAQLNEWGYRFP